MNTQNMPNTLPLRTNCSQCGKLRAHPNFAVGRLDPWMVHARLHFWCKSCMAVLVRDEDMLQALYDQWLKHRSSSIAQGMEGQFGQRVAKRSERIDPYDVFDRDNWVCQLCHEKVDAKLDGRARLGPTLDHIVPVSLGGTHTWDNVQLAHRYCNTSKGNRVRAESKIPPRPKCVMCHSSRHMSTPATDPNYHGEVCGLCEIKITALKLKTVSDRIIREYQGERDKAVA